MSQFATELRDLVDDLVRRTGPAETAEEQRALWAQLRELGLPRVGVVEERGGSGGSFDDLLVLIEALAGHGVSQPVVEAATADWVLSHATAVDDRFTTLVLLDAPLATTGGTVTAELTAVPWAREADRLVVCAPQAPPLVVDLRQEAVTVREGENLAGEPRDTVLLSAAPVAELAGTPAHELVRARFALAWSTAVAGAAHGAYRLTKSYVSEREQFGAPLLKIPAVATNLALMRVELVQADAALAQARETGVSATAAQITRVATAAAATAVAQIAHQLHGAIGITAEYPLQRYTRRLWAWRDAVASERDWAAELGRSAAALGEAGMWTVLTAAGPRGSSSA
ncbi:acyl-CoA dehydrogenase family protein [Streptomyces sp. NPDC051940]|uniref:acyl-CoA dehydrogenase family protein n=1 Tax=Streptomyces sp. NPDC051940 TaxID=3155675 RepID=UPI00341A5200